MKKIICCAQQNFDEANKKFNKLLEYARAQLVEALCYMLKDHGFDS
jgi:hypothetical protein